MNVLGSISGEESWQTNWSILLPCFAADVFGWPDVHWNPLVEVIYHQRLWICHCKPTTNSRGNWWLWRYSTFTNESVQAFSERIIAVIEPMHSEFENGAGLQERDYSYEWISIGIDLRCFRYRSRFNWGKIWDSIGNGDVKNVDCKLRIWLERNLCFNWRSWTVALRIQVDEDQYEWLVNIFTNVYQQIG